MSKTRDWYELTAGKDVEYLGFPNPSRRNVLVQPLSKNTFTLAPEVELGKPKHPEIPPLSIYPRNAHISIKSHTRMFLVALLWRGKTEYNQH